MVEETWSNSYPSETFEFSLILTQIPTYFGHARLDTCVFLQTNKILLRDVLITVSLLFAYTIEQAIG